jgi:hypothetical protein
MAEKTYHVELTAETAAILGALTGNHLTKMMEVRDNDHSGVTRLLGVDATASATELAQALDAAGIFVEGFSLAKAAPEFAYSNSPEA